MLITYIQVKDEDGTFVEWSALIIEKNSDGEVTARGRGNGISKEDAKHEAMMDLDII